MWYSTDYVFDGGFQKVRVNPNPNPNPCPSLSPNPNPNPNPDPNPNPNQGAATSGKGPYSEADLVAPLNIYGAPHTRHPNP